MRYVLAGDPSFKNDAFGVALGHYDAAAPKYIIDGLGRFLPNLSNEEHEIDAAAVASLCLDVRGSCWLTHFVSDTWMFPETQQRIRRTGIEVVNNIVKKEHYDFLKEKVYTNKIEWPESEILPTELKSLELLKGQKVDHPKKGSKDVADATTNCVWTLGESVGQEESIVVIV